jgi:hypothetical protein
VTARRYKTTLSLSIGGDVPTWEGEATVSFEMEWGSPEAGRFGRPEDYDPGSPTYPECITVENVDGREPDRETAEAIAEHIELNDAALDELTTYATESEAADYDAAMERRYEDARERV